MKNAADIEPSREISMSKSRAMSGKMADMLNQFMPYTVLAIIKESDASESELNIPLSLLFNPHTSCITKFQSMLFLYTQLFN
jgi:hypothetical protein